MITPACPKKRQQYLYACCSGAALLCIALTAVAADMGRRSLTAEDVQLVTEANSRFTVCIQQSSLELLDSHDDVRKIAGLAVDKCTPVLQRLDEQLAEKKIHPDFYKGMLEQIKGRSIRRLLPLLMMEKSNRTAPPPAS